MEHVDPTTTTAPAGRRGLLVALGVFALAALLLALVGRYPLLWPLGLGTLALCVTLSPAGEQRNAAEEVATPQPACLPDPAPQSVPVPETAYGGESDDAEGLDAALTVFLESARVAESPLAVHVWLQDASSSSLRLLGATGSFVPDRVPVPLDHEPLGVALSAMSPVTSPIAAVRLGEESLRIWRRAVPLPPADGVPLVLGLDTIGREAPDAEDLAALVGDAAPGIVSAAALMLARAELASLQALVGALDALAGASVTAEVLDVVLDSGLRIAEATTGSVMLWDAASDSLRIVASRGLPAGAEATETRRGEGIAGWVLVTGTPLLVEDLPREGHRPRRSAARSAISVPLASADGVLGVLNIGCPGYPAVAMRPRIDALAVLGRCAAASLSSARA
jgi:hypothetical protein